MGAAGEMSRVIGRPCRHFHQPAQHVYSQHQQADRDSFNSSWTKSDNRMILCEETKGMNALMGRSLILVDRSYLTFWVIDPYLVPCFPLLLLMFLTIL